MQVALGTQLITHDLRLDSILTGDADASVTRLPEPANIKAFAGDRRALGLALRPLETFPVVAMEMPFHAAVFDASTCQQWDAMEAACKDGYRLEGEGDTDLTRIHLKLGQEQLGSEWLPWEALVGVPQKEVVAVLALQASFLMISDGYGWIAAVLLMEGGDLLASTAFVNEGSGQLRFRSMVFSSSLRVKSWEELQRLRPDFAAAMAAPASARWGQREAEEAEEAAVKSLGPLRIASPDIGVSGHWTCGIVLRDWRQKLGEEDPFNPRYTGLEGWPAKIFTRHLGKMPPDFLAALRAANDEAERWNQVVNEVDQMCGDPEMPFKGRGGRGKGKNRAVSCKQPFSTAVQELRTRLSGSPKFDRAVAALEDLASPDSQSYNLGTLAVAAMEFFEVDLLFGPGQREVMYDTWAAAQASQAAKTAAICGGVFLQMSPFMWPRFNAYMNPAGRCFSFDQAANGYVRGECCASAALKPYAEKVDNQLLVVDAPVLGTLVGWRMTNNGRSAGLAAPSGPAEQEAIADCVRHAGISPLDVDAMECHAAGSLLSDGVEVASTLSVLRGMEGGDREMLTVSSAKPNVGVQQEACAMTSFLKVLYNISYANQAPAIHLKQLNPHIELGEAAVNFNNEAMAYRDSRVFNGFGTRGLGGTNINMLCWFSADGSRVPVVKPKMERASFSYWPAGGGMLESDLKASEGYFIIGTWTNWRTPEEMVRQKDGSFTTTVTLGEDCVEAFQILLDGEKDKVLHPERPNALPGSRLQGPTMGYYLHGQNLNWVIDGREVTLPAVEDAISSILPSSSVKQKLRSSQDALAHARDQGQPGDQYEVKLYISGKYRAVTWSKIT
ncbi:ppsA [Symbiodinium natans]|uniref:PpsA protein n=1 Tax=Symbiodinium natans TaxID=878477 RepID=A0A812S2P2_9DINO|nr:ppsA [Symbiodinium natans]